MFTAILHEETILVDFLFPCLNEKGGKNINSRAVSPESVAIHLYWIYLYILHFGQCMSNQVFSLSPSNSHNNVLQDALGIESLSNSHLLSPSLSESFPIR